MKRNRARAGVKHGAVIQRAVINRVAVMVIAVVILIAHYPVAAGRGKAHGFYHAMLLGRLLRI